MQGLHEVALSEDVKKPEGHGTPAVPVPAGQKAPIVQAVPAGDAAFKAQKVPALHGLSVADVLAVAVQKPAAHAPVHVFTVRPVVAPNLPAGQGVAVAMPVFARQ